MREIKEIKFEDIQKANESIVTIDVKGKEYAEVNQRIKAFRMVYPDGAILTEMVQNANGICIFRAKALDGNGSILATGTAYEREGSSLVNKTSYIENAETSSIGRCLGIAGFGIDTSVASAEEVQNAIKQQERLESKTPLIEKMHNLVIEKELDYQKILDKFGARRDVDMTVEQLQKAIKTLEEMK